MFLKYSSKTFPFFHAMLLVTDFVLHIFHPTEPSIPNIAEELDLAMQAKL